MKKTYRLIMSLLVVSLVLPNIAFAAWWNPLSWNVWAVLFTRPTKIQESKNISGVVTTSASSSTQTKTTVPVVKQPIITSESSKTSNEETQAKIDAAVQAALAKKVAADAAAQVEQQQIQQTLQQQQAQQSAQQQAIEAAQQQQAQAAKQAKLNAINSQVADLNANYGPIIQSYKDKINQLTQQSDALTNNISPVAMGRDAVIAQTNAYQVQGIQADIANQLAAEQLVIQEYNAKYNILVTQYNAILNGN